MKKPLFTEEDFKPGICCGCPHDLIHITEVANQKVETLLTEMQWLKDQLEQKNWLLDEVDPFHWDD